MSPTPRVVIVGAGVGGLTAAALLLRAGQPVTVLEAATCAGGCAGTFYHQGFRFDAGVTLVAAFSAQPRLTQSAWFRPHNRADEFDNLYFVGAGTHPGAGLPGVLASAKIADDLLADSLTEAQPRPGRAGRALKLAAP